MPNKHTQEFEDDIQASAFVEDLASQQKYVIRLLKKPEGKFVVEWWDHTTYLVDGEEMPDEIWITRNGEPILVGDMTEEHLRNTLRMILRNRREEAEAVEEELGQVLGDLIHAMTGQPVTNSGTPQAHMVSIDENEIRQQIDNLFPSDIKGNPTLH